MKFVLVKYWNYKYSYIEATNDHAPAILYFVDIAKQYVYQSSQ